MAGIAVRKYQPLSKWDSWEQQSLNLYEEDLSPVDLRDKSSERALRNEGTRNPKVSVKVSVPWNESEDSDIYGNGGGTEGGKAQYFCWGSQCFGLFGSRRKSSPWFEVSLRGEGAEYGRRQNVDQGYRKPSAWKRILRKLRAEAKQVHTACCEGLCLPREDSDYTAFTYEKNFDNGSWQQHTSVGVTTQRALLFAQRQKTWSNNTADIREFSLRENPLGQRRNRDPASKVQAKRVTFADP